MTDLTPNLPEVVAEVRDREGQVSRGDGRRNRGGAVPRARPTAPIEIDEIHLICWPAIEPENVKG